MSAPAVTLVNVSKTFDEHSPQPTVAVTDLSLIIERGEIFSFVGPDGAGKTTLMRMMCGLLPPTDGRIELLGLDVRKQRDQIKPFLGYLSQRFSLYTDLSIDENIGFFAEIHRLKNFGKRKEELLEFTRLTPFRDRLAGRLSGGMKQKLALACTLIHTPEVIFLDEPTTGVDPVSRRDFWKILSDVLKSGITIITATPYLDEAERSSRIALIDKGKLLSCDTPDAIKGQYLHDIFELLLQDSRTVLEKVKLIPDCLSVQLFGDRLHVSVRKQRYTGQTLSEVLQLNGISVTSCRQVSASLEDVFISQMTTTN
jgi:ABC-2 type transport system ATP-binding protein